ncbi:MAG: hypothetical protein FJX65_17175 [Alphaproteobacteria bacterium]|nr:hypothetical protein [Alphaproteobacteria bacterium]
MIRRSVVAVVLAAIAGLTVASASAQSVLPSGGSPGDAYGAVLDRMAAGADGAARMVQERPGDGPALYLDLRRPVAETRGFAALDAGDQALLDAAKRTYDVFRALGGQSEFGTALVQRRGERVYVGLDGDGGRWFTSSAAATAYLLQRLLARSDLPAPAAEAVTSCQNLSCAVQAAKREVFKIEAVVPRGTTVALEVRAPGLATTPPVVSTPAGFVVLAATASKERAEVKLSIPADAPLGISGLHVFNEGRPFRPVASVDLRVVGSVEELEALATGRPVADNSQVVRGTAAETLADDVGNTAATAATLVERADGRIEVPGDVDVYRIVLSAPGVLTASSSGPTDLAATLTGEDGATLASDDDSGAWYNFSLSKLLPAGTYFLNVRHCCNGTGRYTVSISSGAN